MAQFDKLEINKDNKNIEYTFDPKAVFEKDGKTYTFAKFNKKQLVKDKVKFQTMTIRLEDLDLFMEWLAYIVEEMQLGGGSSGGTDPDDVPF